MLHLRVNLENLDGVIRSIHGYGVYSFKDIDGRYLYIGKSIDMHQRVLNHKKWIKELINKWKMDSIAIFRCPIEMIDEIERKAIEFHSPILNNHMNRPKTYVELRVKVPVFMAYKLKERSILSQGRNMSSLAMEGLEYVLSRPIN